MPLALGVPMIGLVLLAWLAFYKPVTGSNLGSCVSIAPAELLEKTSGGTPNAKLKNHGWIPTHELKGFCWQLSDLTKMGRVAF